MIHSFCTKIGFPEEGAACIAQAYESMDARADVMALVEKGKEMVFSGSVQQLPELLGEIATLTGIHRYTSDMAFWMFCAQPLKEKYRENGLPEDMYWNAMQDFSYKLMECYRYSGIWGTTVDWYTSFFTLKRFAFGRLQCDEWKWPHEPYKGIVQTGDTAYRIHIPSAGPLTPELVMDSLTRMQAFFREKHKDGIVPLVCGSWLLYPPLVALFPEGGNIRAFSSLFDRYLEREVDNWGMFRWMFNMDYEGPETLARVPTDTRFRRNAKAYFEAGGKPGVGEGILLMGDQGMLRF